MRLKVLEGFIHKGQPYAKDSELPDVEDTLGRYFCDAGWCADLDGVYPTGSPGPQDVILAPADATQAGG